MKNLPNNQLKTRHFSPKTDRVGIRTISDYSPFGVLLPERTVNAGDFRYAFNGEESVDEVSGEKNSYDFGNRFYSPRIGKFHSLDAYAAKYPSISPYTFAMNSPIMAKDVGGDSVWVYSAAINKSLGVGRHMFMRVKTADRDVIIELYGPVKKVGQPIVENFKPGDINREDVLYHQVWEPIDKNNPDKFENDLIKYAEYFKSQNVYDGKKVIANPLLDKYNPYTNNSNGYIRSLIEYAGGNVDIQKFYFDLNIYEDSPLPSVDYMPGTDWGNLSGYFNTLRNMYSSDEFFKNTFGMTMSKYNELVKLTDKINSSSSVNSNGNTTAPADATRVQRSSAIAPTKKPKERNKVKSGENNL